MVDSINTIAANLYMENILPDDIRQDEIMSSSLIAKSNFVSTSLHVSKIHNEAIQNSYEVGKFHNINSKNVNGLYLISRIINKLQSEAANKIYNQLKKRRLHITKENGSNGWSKSSENSDKEGSYSLLDVTVETYIKMLLVEINLNLLKESIGQPLRLVIFYQLQITSSIIFKQLLSIVPYEDNVPKKTISQLSKIKSDGKQSKVLLPSTMINGSYSYTGDWIRMTKKGNDYKNPIQNIHVKSIDNTLRGFALDYDVNGNTQEDLQESTLYVPGYTDFW